MTLMLPVIINMIHVLADVMVVQIFYFNMNIQNCIVMVGIIKLLYFTITNTFKIRLQ